MILPRKLSAGVLKAGVDEATIFEATTGKAWQRSWLNGLQFSVGFTAEILILVDYSGSTLISDSAEDDQAAGKAIARLLYEDGVKQISSGGLQSGSL